MRVNRGREGRTGRKSIREGDVIGCCLGALRFLFIMLQLFFLVLSFLSFLKPTNLTLPIVLLSCVFPHLAVSKSATYLQS
jgi:hypothetical protein